MLSKFLIIFERKSDAYDALLGIGMATAANIAVKRLYHADRSEIWLPEHIAAFMKIAPIALQGALILGLHTGQREGDLLRMPWSAYDGTRISLRQGKARRGGKLGPLVEIPCTAALRRMLDGMDRVSPLILTTKTGQSLNHLRSATSRGCGMRR